MTNYLFCRFFLGKAHKKCLICGLQNENGVITGINVDPATAVAFDLEFPFVDPRHFIAGGATVRRHFLYQRDLLHFIVRDLRVTAAMI